MRKKEEILDDARLDITNEQYKDARGCWLEYRNLEVLIDIRDILEYWAKIITMNIQTIADKD